MAPSTSEKETILCCDDDQAVCRFVCMILRKHGYNVLEAQSGKQAMEVSEAHIGPIHLLLSDVMMPGLDGPHLAEQLRAVRPDVHVIFMSAYCSDLQVFEGCRLVQKPFVPDFLVKTIRDALE